MGAGDDGDVPGAKRDRRVTICEERPSWIWHADVLRVMSRLPTALFSPKGRHASDGTPFDSDDSRTPKRGIGWTLAGEVSPAGDFVV